MIGYNQVPPLSGSPTRAEERRGVATADVGRVAVGRARAEAQRLSPILVTPVPPLLFGIPDRATLLWRVRVMGGKQKQKQQQQQKTPDNR